MTPSVIIVAGMLELAVAEIVEALNASPEVAVTTGGSEFPRFVSDGVLAIVQPWQTTPSPTSPVPSAGLRLQPASRSEARRSSS